MALLEINDLSKRFDARHGHDTPWIIQDLSFAVNDGEFLTLVGPSGAGKTTLLNMISGFYHPDRGQILLEGTEITQAAPSRIAELGVARTFQNIALFRGMTVLDNLMLGRHVHMKSGVIASFIYWGLAQKEEVRHRKRVADGGNISVVQRLVGFWLDGEADALVMRQHLIEGMDNKFDATARVLGFPHVSALTPEPDYHQVGSHHARHVNAAQRTVDGVLAVLRVVARVGAVNGVGAEPQPGSDHFRGDAFAVKLALHLARFLADLRLGFVVKIRDDVIVVEHHRVEPQFFELRQFPVERQRRADGGAAAIRAFADVARAEAEFVFLSHCR